MEIKCVYYCNLKCLDFLRRLFCIIIIVIMSLVWFITGASSGIGLELALTASRAGHTVIGAMRDRSCSKDAVAAIASAGGRCAVLDVGQVDSISAIVQSILQQEGKIDVLVNNAGYSLLGAVEDMT